MERWGEERGRNGRRRDRKEGEVKKREKWEESREEGGRERRSSYSTYDD